jgi:hypothetical protein
MLTAIGSMASFLLMYWTTWCSLTTLRLEKQQLRTLPPAPRSARRVAPTGIPGFAGTPSPTGGRYRLVYDAQMRYENVTDNLARQ